MKGGQKTVGEWFTILTKKRRGLDVILAAIAKRATFTENAMWRLWLAADPVGPQTVRQRLDEWKAKRKQAVADQEHAQAIENAMAAETGEAPKEILVGKVTMPPLPPVKLGHACRIAKTLCGGVGSGIYDGIANNVAKNYLKKRWNILRFEERLPHVTKPHIRFRDKAVTLRRQPDNERWFEVGLKVKKGQTLWLPIDIKGKKPETYVWLNTLADSGEAISGGCISARRRKGKLYWQISLSREGGNGERFGVYEPKFKRRLYVWAPMNQAEDFLRCQVEPLNGRPWREHVDARPIRNRKIGLTQRRRRISQHHRQDSASAAKGHGRRRLLQGQEELGRRNNNINDSCCEEISTAIVSFAVRTQCEAICIEKLTDRRPNKLQLGRFPYFRIAQRVKEKAPKAMKIKEFPSLETTQNELTALFDNTWESSGGETR